MDGPISRKRELLSLPGSTVVHMRPTSPTSLLNSLLLLNAFAFVFVFLHSLTSLFEKVALQRPPSFASFLDSLFFVFRSLPQLHRAPQELPLRDHSYRRPINLSPFSILHRENICSSHSKRPLCTSKPLTQLFPKRIGSTFVPLPIILHLNPSDKSHFTIRKALLLVFNILY